MKNTINILNCPIKNITMNMIKKIILMLLFLFAYPLNAGALQNKDWFKKENLTKPITFVINGEELDLDKDIDTIVEYYNKKPYDFYFLPKKKTIKEKQKICSKNIKNDIYLLRDGVDEPIKLPHDLTWSEDPFHDRNWVFWFQSWLFTDCLLDGYTLFHDEWYLQRTKSLVIDWWSDNFKTDFPSKEFSWYDHTTPKRLEEFLKIFEFLRQNNSLDIEYSKVALRAIYFHARILAEEDSLYMKDHNHGLDQATALFKTSQIFPEFSLSSQWKSIAQKRLKNQIDFALTSEGVHKENSPSYHMWVTNRCLTINNFSKHYTGDTITNNFSILEKGSRKFIAAITRPDGTFPQLGDTAPNIKGKKRKVTLTTTSVFPESGYFIYHPDNNTQLVFKCGYLSNTHRHMDDGNILLYAHEEDWLIDSGIYGYENNKYRKYVVSPSAHNISFPYNLKLSSSGSTVGNFEERFTVYNKDWGIVEHNETYAVCKSHMFNAYEYKRKLRILNTESFSIEDEISSQKYNFFNTNGLYTTIFKIPSNKDIFINKQAKEILIVNPAGSMALKIKYFKKFKDIKLLHGENKEIYSLETIGYLKLKPSQTIAFFDSTQTYHIKLVFQFISSPNIKGFKRMLSNSSSLTKVLINQDNKHVSFKVITNKENVNYAFYLYKNDIKVDVQWYSENDSYTFNIAKYGKGRYRVHFFIIDNKLRDPGNAVEKEIGYSSYVEI